MSFCVQWDQLGGRAECLPTSTCRPHQCSWSQCSTPQTQVTAMLASLKTAQLSAPLSVYFRAQSLPCSSLSLSAVGVPNEAQTGSVEGKQSAPFPIWSRHLCKDDPYYSHLVKQTLSQNKKFISATHICKLLDLMCVETYLEFVINHFTRTEMINQINYFHWKNSAFKRLF